MTPTEYWDYIQPYIEELSKWVVSASTLVGLFSVEWDYLDDSWWHPLWDRRN